ncbi:MAG: glycerophosphodiester phosphodiesterase [Prevotellaceae bacterium]|jgi:glycerophosphoryl diester phosphodiesterase|nr:glycerophosphodiester phosphodiesterase [Prevotellaceae bacterium]
MKRILIKTMAVCAVGGMLASCEKQQFTDQRQEVTLVEAQLNELPPDLQKVRDYVVPDAIMAHRGSTFWTPEETEAAFRWAREIGADYLELDLQCSKDGVILALHDDNLKRTTDIENVYGEFIPTTRKQYYLDHGLTNVEAETQLGKDKATFIPYYAASYMYEELAKLDAGTWFNIKPEVGEPEQARPAFGTIKQYISTLEDVIRIAEGKKLKRDVNGNREFTVKPIDKSKAQIDRAWFDGSVSYEVEYVFEYEDEIAAQWNGNRPGIYPEFKESWLNPSDMEKRVYAELARLHWNIITEPASANEPFYTGANNTVNVGNTNGKVVLQTFAISSLVRTAEVFGGKVPMNFLLWPNSGSLLEGTPSEYVSSINLAIANKAHIIGPSIAGAPNNYPESNHDWQAYLISKAKLFNHPYSFDTYEQMNKYYGVWDKGLKTDYNYKDADGKVRRYIDGMFTNHADATLKFYHDQGKTGKFKGTESAQDVLVRLGY